MAWQAKEDAEIAEAEAREVMAAHSDASTQRINAEEHQRWDEWAMASELGVASPPKRRKVAVRVSTAGGGTVDVGTVPVGQPLRLSLTMTVDTTEGGEFGSLSSSDPVKLSGEQSVPFLESNLGATIYEWWSSGLVPSVLVKKELGAEMLEAFQAQRSFLQAHDSQKSESTA